MALDEAKSLPLLLIFAFVMRILTHAMCPIGTVIVKGRIEHVPPNAKIRAQLLFAHKVAGDVGEAIPDGSDFKIPIDFLTQSRKPVLVGGLLEKCDRRPEMVVVTLLGGDSLREYERVVLKLHDDFREMPPGTYALKSEISLKGSE